MLAFGPQPVLVLSLNVIHSWLTLAQKEYQHHLTNPSTTLKVIEETSFFNLRFQSKGVHE